MKLTQMHKKMYRAEHMMRNDCEKWVNNDKKTVKKSLKTVLK